MGEMSDKELQDPGTWDFESAETHPGRKAARAIVSVAFSREDFELVCSAAEKRGVKLSALIRAATLASMEIPHIRLGDLANAITSATAKVEIS